MHLSPMSASTPSLFLVLVGSLLSFLYILRSTVFRRKDASRQLPPGPLALPIIGNLHLLGDLPHRSLDRLAEKYGPIMFLKLGNVPTVIVSSPEAAEQILKTQDSVFASRPGIEAFHRLSYGRKGMAFAPYGSYWRSVRKLCTTQLLNSSKIESFAALRREEMRTFVAALREAAAEGEVVDLTERVSEGVEEMMYKMIVGYGKSDEFNLKGLVQEAFALAGAFNLSDYVPLLAPFDIQGLRRSLKRLSKQLDKVLEKIIQSYEKDDQQQLNKSQSTNFVQVLVSLLNKPLNLGNNSEVHIVDRTTIKAIILDMIAGSLDTSSAGVAWAMADLIRNPNAMLKLQQELRTTIGLHNVVEEADLTKLSYLDVVVKETMRLRPIAPLLAPRESMEDATVCGYYIPKNARILVNNWSISRNRNSWSENSEEFIPERFDGRKVDVKGHDFEMIPFGSGRRGCPGLQLGLTATKLFLAQLVHCFDWKLPDGMKPEELDMREKFGLTLPRATPLFVKPIYRLLN